MSTRRRNRDTAKDIILGVAPSGQAPRQPKEGVNAATPKNGNEKATIQRLTSQLELAQQQNRELASAQKHTLSRLGSETTFLSKNDVQAARKRLESSQDEMRRKLTESSGYNARDFDDVRRQMSTMDAKLMMMSNDVSNLRNSMDRQVGDLQQINNEIRSRPVVDPSKLTNTTSQLDGKIRDLHNQAMELQKALTREQRDREKDSKTSNDAIQKLQDILRQQDQARNDVLQNLTKKGDMDKEKLSEESRRLSEKINLITTEVTRKMSENQQRMKDDLQMKIQSLENLIRTQTERIQENEKEMKLAMDNRLNQQAEELQSEKTKQKDRFQKVNEALAALERHLEIGNNKIDKLMNSEIQARKQHEKGLLAKMTDIEDRLNNYMGGMNRSIEDVRSGQSNIQMPSLDTDALRREMEAISADKNKLSMEGLLKLEEKMSRVQQGFYTDRKEMNKRLSDLGDGEHVSHLRAQLNKMDALQEDMEKAQDRIRDKVERQIPQDLNELSAKAENMKHQLNSRIDKEEEERYLAIKELQEAFAQLQQGNHPGAKTTTNDPSMRRDVDECKIAIKKLAESVTTVKNVLDKKISDEAKIRDSQVAELRRNIV